MKTTSLRLNQKILKEADELASKMKVDRNSYINDAVKAFNLYNKRKLLKKQLLKESELTAQDSMDILREFEALVGEDKRHRFP